MKPTIRFEHDTPRPGEPLMVRALLTLAGDLPEQEDRTPLNLSLVLDRSGSMHGEKLRAAREAAVLAVQRLWPDDVVSVVVYDDLVEVVAEPGPGSEQTDLTHRLRAVEARGMTNLSGGWLKARELLARNLRPDGANRILLLTDGLANQGISQPDALMGLCRRGAEERISTTTIGFGQDFDEALLRGMADAGGGATYYIEEPDQAPGVFEEELEGLLSLAAQNLSAEIRPGAAVEIAWVRHSYPSRTMEDGLRLELGDLYARDPKRLLLELLVRETPAAEVFALAHVTLAGDERDADGGMVRRELELPFVLDLESGPRVDPEVRRETLLLDAADARKKAMERRDEGDAHGAAETLRVSARSLREAREGGMRDARLEEEAGDLELMAERVREAPVSPADRKYMAQRIYDSGRSRGAASRKISRRKEE